MEQKIHQGRNVKRFREMLNIKQEALAFDLGEDWNQKKISLLEQKEIIEDPLLKNNRCSRLIKAYRSAKKYISLNPLIDFNPPSLDNSFKNKLSFFNTPLFILSHIPQNFDKKTCFSTCILASSCVEDLSNP